MAKEKKLEEDRALTLTIDKGKRESEFDCLHKMGEACEIAKKLKLNISFTASRGSNNSLRIQFIEFFEDETKERPDDAEPGEIPLNAKPR